MVARPRNGTLVVLLVGVVGCVRGGFDLSMGSRDGAGVSSESGETSSSTGTSTGGHPWDGPSIDATAVGGAPPSDVSIQDGTATGGMDAGNPSTSDASIAGSTGTANGGATGGTGTGGVTGGTSMGGSSSVGTSSGGAATGGTVTPGTVTGGTAAGGTTTGGAATGGAVTSTGGRSSGGGVDGGDTSPDAAMDGASSADTSGESDADGLEVASGYVDASALGDCLSSTYGVHTYVFCNVKVDWATARDNCASIGMQLVRVDDASENQYLYDTMYVSNPNQGIWLGANDLAVEGEWRWPDGTLFWLGDFSGSPQNELYNAWFPVRQPTGQVPAKDCAVLDSAKEVGWYDHDCAMVLEYACESL